MKHVIIIAGDPGTGKTTIAQSIAQKIKAPLLDKDTLCDRFTHFIGEHFLGEDPKHCSFYDSHLRDKEYATLFDVMLENIQYVDTIIMVAPFSSEVADGNEFLSYLEQKIKKYDNDILIEAFVIVCNADENKQRLIQRAKKDDYYKIENWEEYREQRRIGKTKYYNNFVKGVIYNNDFNASAESIIALTKGQSFL